MARCTVFFVSVGPFVARGLGLPGFKLQQQQQHQQQHWCSLEQDTEVELATIRGHDVPGSHSKCYSFSEAIEMPHPVSFIQNRGDLDVKPKQLPVAQGIDYVSFIQNKRDDDHSRLAVWVNGYPRSSSSTILSMVAAAGDWREDTRQAAGTTFSLFEPCHDGDAYQPWLKEQGCSRLLAGVSKCDFNGINKLWGWPNSHTTSNHTKFESTTAGELCQKSQLVAFKTVDYGHNITDWLWFLDQEPNVRVIDIVRDPRGIFSSWKSLEPFKTLIESHDPSFYTLEGVCDNFAANIDLSNDKVHHIVFEELTKNPQAEMQKVYDFLGLPFGAGQEEWIRRTFNAKRCPEPEAAWEVGFTDCHEDSQVVSEKWRQILTDEEKASFNTRPSCQKVAATYGFPLS